MTGVGGTDPAPVDPAVLERLWDFGDPAASEGRIRAALETERSVLAAAELVTQLARSLGLQGRFAEAEALLDAIPVQDAATHPVLAVRIDLERGRLHNSGGRPDRAAPSFRSALRAAESAGLDVLAADAAHMLAIVEPARAVHWTHHGLAIARASDDPRCRRWAGPLHNNLGWTRQDAGDLPGALTEFEAALDAYRQDGTDDQVRLAERAIEQCVRAMRDAEGRGQEPRETGR